MKKAVAWDRVRYVLETAVNSKLEPTQKMRIIVHGFLEDNIIIRKNPVVESFVCSKTIDGEKTTSVVPKDGMDGFIEDALTSFLRTCTAVRTIEKKVTTVALKECITSKEIFTFIDSEAKDFYDDAYFRVVHDGGVVSYASIHKERGWYKTGFETLANDDDDEEPVLETSGKFRSNKAALALIKRTVKLVRPWDVTLVHVERIKTDTLFDAADFEPFDIIKQIPKTRLHEDFMNVVFHPENVRLVVDEKELAGMKDRWHIDTP